MKKTLIFCYSIHHGNTRKLVEAIQKRLGAEVIMLPCKESPNLKDYELVGFASGIYMSSFGDSMLTFADSVAGLDGKDCFTMYTSGANSDKLDKGMLSKLEGKGAHIVGRFSCRGFDTFGPFKLVGGLQKGRPNGEDIEKAVSFCEGLMA